jgi:hypothetical protein
MAAYQKTDMAAIYVITYSVGTRWQVMKILVSTFVGIYLGRKISRGMTACFLFGK